MTLFENDSQSSTATAAALMRDVPPTIRSASTATRGTVSERLSGSCESVEPIATAEQMQARPVIANDPTDNNLLWLVLFMISSPSVNNCETLS